MSFKIIQINVGRATKAHDVALAAALRSNTDLILFQEPNKKITKRMGLISDMNMDVAVLVLNKKVGIWEHSSNNIGYIKLIINGTALYNCYISPNITKREYEDQVNQIMEDARIENNPRTIILTSNHGN